MCLRELMFVLETIDLALFEKTGTLAITTPIE